MVMNAEDISLINQGLVDSRVKITSHSPVKTLGAGRWEITYCIFCSKPAGMVTVESFEFAKVNNCIRICDDCVNNMGSPNLQEVPQEFIHEAPTPKRFSL